MTDNLALSYIVKVMADKKKAGRTETQTWRPTSDDYDLLDQLMAKLGVSMSQIVRIGLRKLAEAEGLKFKKAS